MGIIAGKSYQFSAEDSKEKIVGINVSKVISLQLSVKDSEEQKNIMYCLKD